MRAALVALALVLLACAGRAEESAPATLQLADGRAFAEWQIVSQTATTVFVRHKDGGATVAKTLLPAELRELYPVRDDEAAKASAFDRAGEARRAKVEADRVAEYQRRVAAAAQEREAAAAKEAARQARNNAPMIVPPEPTAPAPEDPLLALVRQEASARFAPLAAGRPLNAPKPVIVLQPAEEVPGWSDQRRVRGTWTCEHRHRGVSRIVKREFSAVVREGAVLQFSEW